MLRLTVELVPFGIEKQKRVLGVVRIWNRGTGTPAIGHYEVDEFGPSGAKRGGLRITHYPRAAGWLPLCFMALQGLAEGWASRRGNRGGWSHRFSWQPEERS